MIFKFLQIKESYERNEFKNKSLREIKIIK
jgi:hypothetical protein